MKRTILRALIVGSVFVITYFAFQFLRIIYLSYNYVPNMMKSYDSIDPLQHKISIGISGDPMKIVFEVVALFLLGMIMYFGVRKIRGKK